MKGLCKLLNRKTVGKRRIKARFRLGKIIDYIEIERHNLMKFVSCDSVYLPHMDAVRRVK